MVCSGILSYIVYKHTFQTSGKSYIGSTSKTIEYRLKQHIGHANNGSKTHFHRALRKYGTIDIISEILEDDIVQYNINDRESYWIDHFDTFFNGYNSTTGGQVRYSMTDDIKSKMSKSTIIQQQEISDKKRLARRKKLQLKITNDWKNMSPEKYAARCKAQSLAQIGKSQPKWKKEQHSQRMSGSGNSHAKIIHIYDNNNIIQFSTHGNFKKVCNIHNLPLAALLKSYRTSGTAIYKSKRGITAACQNGNEKYIGWFALIQEKLDEK